MIKKFPVKKQWQVNPICDNCNKIMIRDESKTILLQELDYKVLYSYICPVCGEIFRSKIYYPYTQVEFELKKGEIVNE